MVKSKDWHAWLNTMPPKPDDFHVVGDVFVGNPGVQGELGFREPQGFNPAILLLDLHLVQRPGMWIQSMSWIQCRYDRVVTPNSQHYTDVEVFHEGVSIATMKVVEIQ